MVPIAARVAAAFGVLLAVEGAALAYESPFEVFLRRHVERPFEHAMQRLGAVPPQAPRSAVSSLKVSSSPPASAADASPSPPDRTTDAVPIPRERPPLFPKPKIASAIGGEPAIPHMAVTVTAPVNPYLANSADSPPPSAPAKPDTRVASLTPSGGVESTPLPPGGLAALGVTSVPLPPIADGGCTVPDPVAVASFDHGTVPLTPKATVDEKMAETVAAWVSQDVEPAARGILLGQLTGLRILDSYDCRSVDRIAGAKLSQHGLGNAMDVGAFRIDKRWIVVGSDLHDHPDDAKFLDTIRAAACKRFMTVLGPGSDDYHSSHFHLDIGKHGKSGTYRICE